MSSLFQMMLTTNFSFLYTFLSRADEHRIYHKSKACPQCVLQLTNARNWRSRWQIIYISNSPNFTFHTLHLPDSKVTMSPSLVSLPASDFQSQLVVNWIFKNRIQKGYLSYLWDVRNVMPDVSGGGGMEAHRKIYDSGQQHKPLFHSMLLTIIWTTSIGQLSYGQLLCRQLSYGPLLFEPL